MKSRFIIKRVWQAIISWLIAIFVGLFAVGYLGAITCLPYFQAMIRGPLELSARQLSNYQDSTQHFIQVDGLEMYDTGFEYTSSSYGITTEHSYYGALAVGTKLLIIKSGSPIDASQLSYLGTLAPASQSVRQEIIAVIVSEQPDLDDVFLPIVLDASSPYSIWWYLGGILWLILLGICMWLLMGMMNTLFQPKDHHILKALAKYGDVQTVIDEIESEIPSAERVGKLKLGKTWLIVDSFGDFQAVRLDEIVWFYKHITQHSYNGIPTGKTFRVYLYDKNAKQINVKDSMKNVETMLYAINRIAPWAFAGYTPELLRAWEFQKAEFLATVEQRKSQLKEEEQQA